LRNPPSPEQLRYARLLDIGSKLGFVMLVAGFLAYVTGVLEEHVVVGQLPALWGLPLAEYLRVTQTPTGWGWIAHLHKGEFAGLLGIAVLAGCSLVCLTGIIPLYARRGERTYAIICTLEIIVMLLAASGILTVSH
jgi:hypothetical protein